MRIARAMMAAIVFGAAMLIIPLGGTTPPSSHAHEELIVELNWKPSQQAIPMSAMAAPMATPP